jgi:hypothetical protein
VVSSVFLVAARLIPETDFTETHLIIVHSQNPDETECNASSSVLSAVHQAPCMQIDDGQARFICDYNMELVQCLPYLHSSILRRYLPDRILFFYEEWQVFSLH